MLDKKTGNRQGEQGNVLFLILIAVALFAALSYAVTQSTRSGGGDASDEGNLVNSAQITQYPASVRTSIVRMVIGGADVATLEFNAPSDFGNCTEVNGVQIRCVFHPDGGGATHQNAPGEIMTSGTSGGWRFNAENEINLIGRTSDTEDSPGADTADLIAFLPGVTNGICERINEELGITTVAADITETGILFDSASDMVNEGSATSIGASGNTIGGTDVPALDAQPFGCFKQVVGAETVNVYYHVLIER